MKITRRVKKETSIASWLRPCQPALGVVGELGSILEGRSIQEETVLFKFGSHYKTKALLRLLKF